MSRKQSTAHSHLSAFTLIELSIVLVIIGLIVGGVLVRQDLIRAAALRAQIADIEKLNTAVDTFRGKYDCLPGDCANATSFFGAVVRNGNGDGHIDAMGGECGQPAGWDSSGNSKWVGWVNGCGAHPNEYVDVFDQLAAAGLWGIATYDMPTDASNSPGIGYPAMKMPSTGGHGCRIRARLALYSGWSQNPSGCLLGGSGRG